MACNNSNTTAQHGGSGVVILIVYLQLFLVQHLFIKKEFIPFFIVKMFNNYYNEIGDTYVKGRKCNKILWRL